MTDEAKRVIADSQRSTIGAPVIVGVALDSKTLTLTPGMSNRDSDFIAMLVGRYNFSVQHAQEIAQNQLLRELMFETNCVNGGAEPYCDEPVIVEGE